MYVELKDINKTYAGYQASNHVSFGIEQGRLIALLGPSGSGKTTILRMIAGLETPDSGEIVIDGKVVNNIPASERGIGFVFQNYALFRYMTVYDNIAFGLNVKKENKKYIPSSIKAGLSNRGEAYRGDNKSQSMLANLMLTYKKSFGKHYINALGLAEVQRVTNSCFGSTVHGFSTDDFYITICRLVLY